MKNSRRPDKKSSRTAAYTCMCGAASYIEKNPYLKSDDYIAIRLLPVLIKFLIKFNILRLKSRISPKGIYPYVVARTKYIDHTLRTAIGGGFEQIVIMGAGFDSREIRFSGLNGNLKIYETDTYQTIDAKLKQYTKRKIRKPENNILIPLDFEKENIKTKLIETSFGKDKKTLFILEGLIMYLSEDTVKETFEFIHEYSASGSMVVFDYVHASVLRQENKYFKTESGKIITKNNGTHCLVLAKKNDK